MSRAAPWCVVPVKGRRHAKRRLAPLLAPDERAALVEAMLRDVLAALSQARGLAGVMLVTGDPGFATIGRDHGCRIVDDPVDEGTTAAVMRGAAVLAAVADATMAVLHADLPLATSEAIEALISPDPGGAPLTLVPDRARQGTNALLATPVDLIPFSFGPGSFCRHAEAAAARDVSTRILDLPELAQDIDRPEDLAVLASARGATARLLAESGLADRLRIAERVE